MSRDRDNWYLPCRSCSGKPQHMSVNPWNPWPKPHHDDCCDSCGDSAMRLKLFSDCRCDNRGAISVAPPVTITNPWNCRERAVVCLSIDECGNLVVSVRRENC